MTMSTVALMLCFLRCLRSALASYADGVTTTNSNFGVVPYRPLSQAACASKSCGENCVLEGDMAGLCDERGECSFNYEVVAKKCPPIVSCGPVCAMYCEFGNVLDASGCPICQCRKAPSTTVMPPIVACPPVCEMYCEFGNFLDEFGCPVCECKTKFVVKGQLVLESPSISGVNIHVSFARAIAHVAGASAQSVQINNVKFLILAHPRRLSQFLASSDVSRRLFGALIPRQIINFTIDGQNRQELDHMALALSRISPAAMELVIYEYIPATIFKIHVVNITAVVAEVPSPIARALPGGPPPEDTHSRIALIIVAVVALMISLIGCLLSSFAVFWFLCRSSARVDDESKATVVVATQKDASLQRQDMTNAALDGGQQMFSNIAKEEISSCDDDSVDDVSTQASSNPSISSSKSALA